MRPGLPRIARDVVLGVTISGAITAATIKALVPDPGGYKSARHFAAWVAFQRRQGTTGRNL